MLRESKFVSWLTIIGLAIGGVALPVVGWVVSAVLLWASPVWSLRDKIRATLMVPGGLIWAALLLLQPSTTSACGEKMAATVTLVGHAYKGSTVGCNAAGFHPAIGLAIILLALTVGLPLYSAYALARALRWHDYSTSSHGGLAGASGF